MAQLWLVSMTGSAPVTIGADRMAVALSAEWETFRGRLNAVHPRLLPLFKARLLPAADEDEASCGGAESGEIELDSGEAIVFDSPGNSGGAGMRLSHCGEAFLDRLLEPEEALELIRVADQGDKAYTETQRRWMDTMTGWWRQNLSVVLLSDE